MGELRGSYLVVKSPLITEKASRLGSFNKYIFWVDQKSNKIQIRAAIEAIYKVKVKSVQTLVVKGKTKRLRMGQTGKTPNWKKALVTLKKGEQIKIT